MSRPTVEARAPDGSVYEAYCGHDDPKRIVPGHGFVSTLLNRRHRYGGAPYHPQDVFIGKPESGRLKPSLFFRDVGSHSTAPHSLAIDSEGQCHLMVADIVIYEDNRLHLYWVVGDPGERKWTAAWLMDRRGFTSSSQPWSAAWDRSVHLLWNWEDADSHGVPHPGSGVYHVERTPEGFGRKVRVVPGHVTQWDAALEPKAGRLLLVFSKNDGVYVTTRKVGEKWTKPARLHAELKKGCDVSAEPVKGGAFVIRTHREQTREWLLNPD
jgi:hypothetical protein